MKLQLRVLSGSRRGDEFVFSKSAIAIGRHPSSDLQFHPEQDIDVSTRHAVIEKRSDGWWLRDLQSRNGTLVNGHPITADTRLDDTDQVQFGTHGPRLEARLVKESVPDAAPPLPEGALADKPTRRVTHDTRPRPSSSGQSATQRIRVEVAKATRGLKLLIGLLAIVLAGSIGMFLYLEAERDRERAAEAAALQARIDSILATSERTIQGLQGELAGLAAALQDSRQEVRRLSTDLAQARASGDRTRAAELRRQLDRASAALSSQQAVAGVDWSSVYRANQQAVALLTVELGPGEVTQGTAFAVNREGLMVTNRHVVAGSEGTSRPIRMGVKFADSHQFFPAFLVAISPEADVALVRTPARPISTVVELSQEDSRPAPGEPAAIIGFPGGESLPMSQVGEDTVARTSLTAGIISKSLGDVVQLDAFGTQGASGSPVFDPSGKVIAVLYGGQEGSDGRIVFGVPVSYVRDLIANTR